MRIAFIIKRFSTEEVFGGAERFAVGFVEELVRRGASVSILSTRYKKEWSRREKMGVWRGGEKTYVEIRRLAYPNVRVLRSLVYILQLFLKLLKDRNTYDIVFVNFASIDAGVAALAGRLAGRPVVCRITGPGPTGDIGVLKRRWYGPLLISMLRMVSRFSALSSEVRDELTQIGVRPERIVSLSNGVDTGRFAPPNEADRDDKRRALGIAPGETFIVSVGRLVPLKAFPVFLRALRLIGDTRIPFKAMILGKGPMHDRLVGMVNDLDLQEFVKIGSAGDVKPFLQAADIFVLSSRWEGMSNALLEAMSCGLACICSDIPANAGVINHCDNGILFRTDDHVQLAACLEQLALNQALRSQLGRRARETICRKYSLQLAVQGYLELFNRLVHGSSADSSGTRRTAETKPLKAKKELICR